MRTANEIAVASAVLVLEPGAAAADAESDTAGQAGKLAASGAEPAADQAAAGAADAREHRRT